MKGVVKYELYNQCWNICNVCRETSHPRMIVVASCGHQYHKICGFGFKHLCPICFQRSEAAANEKHSTKEDHLKWSTRNADAAIATGKSAESSLCGGAMDAERRMCHMNTHNDDCKISTKRKASTHYVVVVYYQLRNLKYGPFRSSWDRLEDTVIAFNILLKEWMDHYYYDFRNNLLNVCFSMVLIRDCKAYVVIENTPAKDVVFIEHNNFGEKLEKKQQPIPVASSPTKDAANFLQEIVAFLLSNAMENVAKQATSCRVSESPISTQIADGVHNKIYFHGCFLGASGEGDGQFFRGIPFLTDVEIAHFHKSLVHLPNGEEFFWNTEFFKQCEIKGRAEDEYQIQVVNDTARSDNLSNNGYQYYLPTFNVNEALSTFSVSLYTKIKGIQ